MAEESKKVPKMEKFSQIWSRWFRVRIEWFTVVAECLKLTFLTFVKVKLLSKMDFNNFFKN